MIDTNGNLMIAIIDPQGKIFPYYFSENPDYENPDRKTAENYYKAIRDYIQNESIHFSLKYDLQLADKKAKETSQESGGNISTERNLFNLFVMLNKHDHIVFMDQIDHRYAHAIGKVRQGSIFLPTDLEYLPETQQDALIQLAGQITIVQTSGCIKPIPNKIIYRKLPVSFYHEAGDYDNHKLGNFDQVIATLLEARAFYCSQSELSLEENTHKR